MDPILKQKWIDTLLSGKYEQGQGMLRSREEKFCCLGVLCDITEPSGWDKDPKADYKHYHEPEIPNEYVMRDLGLELAEANHLAKLNDGDDKRIQPHTFVEIAEYIKKHL